MDPKQELENRPTYEQSAQQYGALLTEVRAALQKLNPHLVWTAKELHSSGRGFCRDPYTDVDDAWRSSYDLGYAKGAVSDGLWPELEQQVLAIAARYGFTQVLMSRQDISNHILTIGGPWGASLEVGSVDNTTLAIDGACFLKTTSPQPTVPVSPTP